MSGKPGRKCVTCGRTLNRKVTLRVCDDGRERCVACIRNPTFHKLPLISGEGQGSA